MLLDKANTNSVEYFPLHGPVDEKRTTRRRADRNVP